MKKLKKESYFWNALIDNLECRRRLNYFSIKGDMKHLVYLSHLLKNSLSKKYCEKKLGRDIEINLKEKLTEINVAVEKCQKCSLGKTRKNIVFDRGDCNARLMLIGEAPGSEEDLKGMPFVGLAGKLLDRICFAVGLRREEIYITNILKCRPPKNRDPLSEEIDACHPFLEDQINLVNPKVICTLGRHATSELLGKKISITAIRGVLHRYKDIPFLPTLHPAFLLRSPKFKGKVYKDFKKILEILR